MSMLTPRGHSDARRRQGSATGMRVLVVVLAIVSIGAASWVAWTYSSSTPARSAAAPTPSCPAPSPTPTVVAAGEIRVNVYNATDRRGLASRVARSLKQRGFLVRRVDNDPAKRAVTGAAEVRHGPAGTDAARTVAAQVGTVVLVPDERTNASVDLALGAGFVRLQAVDVASAAASPTPAPRPSGC